MSFNTMSKESLKIFLDNIGSYKPREDNYDISGWSDILPDEKVIAEGALFDAAQKGDTRAIVTIGLLNLNNGIEIINELAKSSNPWIRFSANRSLQLLGGSSEGLKEDATSENWIVRLGAAIELKGKDAEKTFLNLLEDSDYAVRSTALDNLIDLYQLKALKLDSSGRSNLAAPLSVLDLQLLSKVSLLWQKGSAEAVFIFTSLASGKSPEAIGLVYKSSAPKDFISIITSSFFDYENPFATNLIELLEEHDRNWAEVFLIFQLDYFATPRCSRAIVALEQLKVKWALPALEELLKKLKPEQTLYLETAKAIKVLSM